MDKSWIVFLIIGVLMSIITFSSIIKGRKSRTWPSTIATVAGTEVEIKREYDEDGDHTYYYPRVYYEYEVSGQHYTGNRIKLLEASSSRRKAQSFIENYNQGDKISIFFHPESPSEAVIFTGEQKYLYIFCVASIVLTIVSIVKLFF